MSELQNIADMTGKWLALAESWDFNHAKTGTPQIVVTFKIAGGPFDGDRVTWFGSFSERASDRTLESLRYAGWTGDDLSAIEALPTEVELEIELEEYEGRYTNKVQWVNKAGRVKVQNAMSDDQLRAFAATMRGKAVASRAKLQPAPVGASSSPAPTHVPKTVHAPSPAQRKPLPYTPPHKRAQGGVDDGRTPGDPGPDDADLGF